MERVDVSSIVEAFEQFGIAMREMAESMALTFKRIDEEYERFLGAEEEREPQSLYFSLNLERPIIKHQVISRKPRHVIRKILY